jgi:hypothetical protein
VRDQTPTEKIQAALNGLPIVPDHRQQIGRRGVPTRRELGDGPMRRDLRRDNQGERPYCLTRECSRSIELCPTKSAPVASSCSARIRAPFPLFDISCLLLWALWGCGRRARVVQAQRQIHRALGKAGVIKPSTPRAGRLVIHSGAGASSGHVCG